MLRKCTDPLPTESRQEQESGSWVACTRRRVVACSKSNTIGGRCIKLSDCLRDGTEECSESKAGRASLSVCLSPRRRTCTRGVLCGPTIKARPGQMYLLLGGTVSPSKVPNVLSDPQSAVVDSERQPAYAVSIETRRTGSEKRGWFSRTDTTTQASSARTLSWLGGSRHIRTSSTAILATGQQQFA